MPKAGKTPYQALAEALKSARSAARNGVLKSSDLSRVNREKLLKAQYLTEVVRGWYLLTTPEGAGGSTAWFSSIWAFMRHYLEDRFGENGYRLSAESSLNLHAGETSIPQQITVLTLKNSNAVLELPHNISLFLRTDPHQHSTDA